VTWKAFACPHKKNQQSKIDRSLNLNACAKKNDRRPASKFLVSGYWNGVEEPNLLVFNVLAILVTALLDLFRNAHLAGKAAFAAYAKILRLKSLHRKEP
jgi:hypothetical protein